MHFNLKDIRRIAGEVARKQNPALEVVGANPVGEESSYAEVMLTVHGCRQEPCRVLFNVTRNTSEAELRTLVAKRLREHLAEHQLVSS